MGKQWVWSVESVMWVNMSYAVWIKPERHNRLCEVEFVDHRTVFLDNRLVDQFLDENQFPDVEHPPEEGGAVTDFESAADVEEKFGMHGHPIDQAYDLGVTIGKAVIDVADCEVSTYMAHVMDGMRSVQNELVKQTARGV